jgi:hypothetical protein
MANFFDRIVNALTENNSKLEEVRKNIRVKKEAGLELQEEKMHQKIDELEKVLSEANKIILKVQA